jgi:hypothetical protein
LVVDWVLPYGDFGVRVVNTPKAGSGWTVYWHKLITHKYVESFYMDKQDCLDEWEITMQQ